MKKEYVEALESLNQETKIAILAAVYTVVNEAHYVYSVFTPDERERIGKVVEDIGLYLADKGITAYMKGENAIEEIPKALARLDSPFIGQIANAIREALSNNNGNAGQAA